MAQLPYDPSKISRELARHYIPATEADIRAMFAAIGSKDFPDMYSHIEGAVKFPGAQDLPDELEYQALADRMESLSKRNSVKAAFLGDGLQVYRTNGMVGHVCSIRNLTTSYTRYQPERYQGPPIPHWISQPTLAPPPGPHPVPPPAALPARRGWMPTRPCAQRSPSSCAAGRPQPASPRWRRSRSPSRS